jgi:ankyrin repeat protein
LNPLRALLVTAGLVGLVVGGSLALAPRAGAVGDPPPGDSAPGPPDLLMPELFQAAARNDVAAVKALLAKGANPNCRNFLSFTPLFLAAAAGHEEAVNTLLAGGAELDTPSPYGTALTFAALANQPRMAQFLIARGAGVNPSRGDRITLLMLAANNGDLELAKTVLAKGVAVNAKDADGATALIYAARNGELDVARLLLSSGALVDDRDSHRCTALMYAAANGYEKVAALLLGKGANPNGRDDQGRTPLLLAASYGGDAGTLLALLQGGADVHALDSRRQTALDLLARRGKEPLVAMLKARGAKSGAAKVAPPAPAEAIARGLSLIQHSTLTFQERAQCMSCHHQGLGLMVTGLGKERGFGISTGLAAQQIDRAVRDFEGGAAMLQKAVEVPELAKLIPSAEIGDLTPGAGFALAGVAAHRKPADPALSALAVILGRQQFPDGHWQFGFPRIPIQSSYFTMTALAVRALQVYAPKEQAAETADRIRRAQAWLRATPARTTEDRAFRLLALRWTGAPSEDREKAAAELLGAQRPDGGWSEAIPGRSDAYATGQALYALNQAGGVPAADAAYRRGVNYLLRTQDEDGSWYVSKRAMPANNYLDAGFPHGESQYVSYGATAWATMALMLATDPPARPRQARR